MKAIDTNILARYIVNDDTGQAQRATAILREPCFVPDTVLLETAWLLSSRYGMKRGLLSETLRDLLSIPTLSVSDSTAISLAIDRFAAGADFADMMHLISATGADSFISFDDALAKEAGPNAPMPIETLA